MILPGIPRTSLNLYRLDIDKAIQDTQNWWREWSDRCSYYGKWRDAVLRSLITLKARWVRTGLTFLPTGGIAAAPTTSLPELLGGVRNWDYRFCWVRDATLTLHSLLDAGYHDEARDWREWLLRAVAGSPSELNIVYGLRGERGSRNWNCRGSQAMRNPHQYGPATLLAINFN